MKNLGYATGQFGKNHEPTVGAGIPVFQDGIAFIGIEHERAMRRNRRSG
jgi:hypothetical protein